LNQRKNPNQSDRRLLTVSDRDIFVTTQKALLIGIVLKNETRADKEESLKELVNLVETAGSSPTIIQTKRVEKIDPKTFIGKGSIKELVDISDANDIDVVLFDCELTPSQQKELRALFKCDVVDRTGLILDIFALHAQSKEASLQVELALSIYLKPRLAGLGKTLNQQGGGIGTRGPGETKLETDTRLIDNRINKLKREIKKVSKQREVQSSFRKKNNTPLVSIVGYTNAGKSTMLEKITSSKTYVANELFATVDSLQRELKIDGINEHIILSDTVGFIQNLPTTLIESFKSTLTVVKEANLLIHVVDAASAMPEMHINTVHEILDQIEANVPELLVFNKIDRIDRASLNFLMEKYPNATFVSSTKGTNIENLVSEITTNVFGESNEVKLLISPKDLDKLHKYSSIINVENNENGLEVIVKIRNYYLENLLQKDIVKLLS
jgi:GTP-binding protein HflX|tara:strand:- start:1055 stop:2374 length:1320 start_codon:yes stop_codon:yes gene_type:complete